MLSTSGDTNTSGLQTAMLKFRLPVTSRSNERSAIELRVAENIGVAVGISLLSCLEGEI